MRMNKNGFGFLRLPRLDGADEKSIDLNLLCSMVDRFLEQGGDYFDTAYTYLEGASEEALRKTLVERYPRERFRIADKLPGYEVRSQEDNWNYFEESLQRCGVDYFDVYLLHGLNAENYAIAQKYDQFSFLRELKRRGKAKKIGFSFHDTAEMLDQILTEQPDVDYVQLQINYLDWESLSVQSRKCYETAMKHGKRVLVMEPVKGGCLAKLPEAAQQLLKELRSQDSFAHWAIRFASELDGVEIVLSGMNAMEQMEDNMRPMHPLSTEEHEALSAAAKIIQSNTAIGCTGCGYCTAGCPAKIPIPQYFALFNEYQRSPKELWKTQIIFESMTRSAGEPSACRQCRQCEGRCPQKLDIVQYLQELDGVFSV